jgi:2,4-dienoyl-CoA reductase-like NADH-dependent reductase (Old Yellow Enzyme family)/thioredoxin reductase
MKNFNKYPDVFKPLKVGPTVLKNRLQFPPMVCCHSNSIGEVTQEYVDFIEMQARTGVALVTIGATPVDNATGQDFRGELNIADEAMLPGLQRIAEAAHDYGAKLSVEMCHAGRGADPDLLLTPYALAPSVIPLPHRKRYVKEMDQKDIDHVINQYADVADRLARAGFDMCMIHGGHGNLIGQFMSPSTNMRNDWYGGSFENRMRFPLQIMEAMRAKVGSRIAIEMRISGDEIIPNGMHLDEVLKFLPMAQKYIDLVNISRGLIVDHNYHFYTQPPYYNEYCHNVKYAREVKKVLDIPVSVVGSIKTLKDAQEIISSGAADVVAMCRQLMADPDTIKKSKAGKEDEIRPCLRCLQVCNKNVDAGKPVRCAVNPIIGREGKFYYIPPAPEKKKVVVVGGGPAGMMAAQTLTKRGHSVVLFEAEDTLGGHLPNISKLPFKDDLRQYTDWDVRTTLRCGADIRLGTKATPELIEAENPDALIIATGSRLLKPPIPGIDGPNVSDVISVDSGKTEIKGKKVIICGGGMSGLECALGLAMKGKEVTVIDMIPVDQFAVEIVNFTRNMLFKLLREHEVTFIGEQKIRKITAEGVETMDKEWNTHFYMADHIVTAFGLVPNDEDMEAFLNIVPETYPVGDCWYGNKSIANANTTAFNFAMEI